MTRRKAARAAHPTLSKSKYLAGLQCERRVWLQVHDRALATPVDAAQQAIFDTGTEVGEYAHELFPGGVLVDEKPWQHAEAVARTQSLMADPSVPAIFEAAFEHDGVRIRVDVLERLAGDAWGLREVKSSTRVKAENRDDLAVQLFVLEGAGLRIASSELIHIDNRYERDQDGIDWPGFFARADCSAALAEQRAAVPARVRRFHGVLAEREAPAIEPGFHCSRPYRCEFWAHCTRNKPEDWVKYLPRLSPERVEALRSAGHERISKLPADVELSETQARVRDAVQSGRPFVSPNLPQALGAAGPPAWYLDFETANPAIPMFAGTRPYQMLPFQWSLHRVDTGGNLSHQAFLADGSEDPRRAFCQSLLDALPTDAAPIHVYSPFEATRLAELAADFPRQAAGLDAIRARLFDQLQLVRRHLYHPGFASSYSIKQVAPALAPGFSWDDLQDIAEGSAAAAAWPRLARGELTADEAARTRQALLDYCARDTLAMVELHRVVRKM
ncbi:MAG: DUF2779 domain-containing protein [Myxococcota bacterium]|nr:DUF2779 domain-containing protein [Myxococcota bacterium]